MLSKKMLGTKSTKYFIALWVIILLSNVCPQNINGSWVLVYISECVDETPDFVQ